MVETDVAGQTLGGVGAADDSECAAQVTGVAVFPVEGTIITFFR